MSAELTDQELINEELKMLKQDPFAIELAKRLAIADVSSALGTTFRNTYNDYQETFESDRSGSWMYLAMICLEDKTFGHGHPKSIAAHPLLQTYPQLQTIIEAKTNAHISHIAKRFQAAFDTLETFSLLKPQNGIASFNRYLAQIDQPEDLWIVLVGLRDLISAKCKEN